MKDVFEKFVSHLPFHYSEQGALGKSDISINLNADIVENKKFYKMTAELPVFLAKEIHMNLSDRILTLSDGRNYKYEDRNRNYHLMQKWYGSYKRSFSIPSSIEEGGINVDVKLGMLQIRYPNSVEPTQNQHKAFISS
jgi:HSP20 family protein